MQVLVLILALPGDVVMDDKLPYFCMSFSYCEKEIYRKEVYKLQSSLSTSQALPGFPDSSMHNVEGTILGQMKEPHEAWGHLDDSPGRTKTPIQSLFRILSATTC